MHFKSCKIFECDFSLANCYQANFENSDLTRSLFQDTDIRKADFTSAINYSIHPERNKIRGARFAYPGLLGLLDAFQIKVI